MSLECGRESFYFSSTFYSTVVSIYYGLRAVGLGDQGLWAVITFYIGEFLIFVFEVYLILSKRNKEKNSVSMGNTRGKKNVVLLRFLAISNNKENIIITFAVYVLCTRNIVKPRVGSKMTKSWHILSWLFVHTPAL